MEVREDSSPEIDSDAADSNSIELLIERARDAFKEALYESALALWSRVIAVRPNRAGPWFESAKCASALGLHDDAVRRVESAIELRENEPVYEAFLQRQHLLVHERSLAVVESLGSSSREKACSPTTDTEEWAIDRFAIAQRTRPDETACSSTQSFIASHVPDLSNRFEAVRRNQLSSRAAGTASARAGHSARRAGHLEQARVFYLDAVQKCPDNLTAWKSLVEVQLAGFDVIQADLTMRNMERIVPKLRRVEMFLKVEKMFLKVVRGLCGAFPLDVEMPLLSQPLLHVLSSFENESDTDTDASTVGHVFSCFVRAQPERIPLLNRSLEARVRRLNLMERQLRKLVILCLAGRLKGGVRQLAVECSALAVRECALAPEAYRASSIPATLKAVTRLDRGLRLATANGDDARSELVAGAATLLVANELIGFEFLSILALRTVLSIADSHEELVSVPVYGWYDCLFCQLRGLSDDSIAWQIEQSCKSGTQELAVRSVAMRPARRFSSTSVVRIARALRKAGEVEAALGLLVDGEHDSFPALRERAMACHALGRPFEAIQIWQNLRRTDKVGERQNFKGLIASVQLAQGPKAAEKVFLGRIESNLDVSWSFLEAAIAALRGLRSLRAAALIAERIVKRPYCENATLLRSFTGFYAELGGDVRTIYALASTWHRVEPDRDSIAVLDLATEAIALGEDLLERNSETVSIAAIGIDVVLRATSQRNLATGDGPVTLVLPSMGPGGIQRQVFNTVNGLIGNQPDRAPPMVVPVSMAARNFDFYLERFEAIGAEVALAVPEAYAPRLIDVPNRDLVRRGLALLPERSARTIGYFADLFIDKRPELVHGWYDTVNVWAGIAARIAGVPRVLLGARSIAPRGRRREIVEATPGYRSLLAFDNVEIATLCDASAVDFKEWLDLPDEKVRVVYLGVDEEQFDHASLGRRQQDAWRELSVPSGTVLIGSAFRFSHEKRPLLWLEGAAELARRRDDVHFVLLGDGRLVAESQQHARRLGIAERVTFVGLTQDIAAYVSQLDVLLLTSDFEGTSNIVPEAQTLGVPVVATRVGGLPEAFEDGVTGFSLSADPSAREIAETVLKALDPEWSAKARPLARKFARKRFGIQRMVHETASAYGWLTRHAQSAPLQTSSSKSQFAGPRGSKSHCAHSCLDRAA